jgi:hypothetical protein
VRIPFVSCSEQIAIRLHLGWRGLRPKAVVIAHISLARPRSKEDKAKLVQFTVCALAETDGRADAGGLPVH